MFKFFMAVKIDFLAENTELYKGTCVCVYVTYKYIIALTQWYTTHTTVCYTWEDVEDVQYNNNNSHIFA